MHFFFLDPSLSGNTGHHANMCRYIVRETRERGIPTRVVGNVNVDQDVKNELEVVPLFRRNAYWLFDNDPICGWLTAFMATKELLRGDLQRIADIGSDDLVMVSGAQPAQLLGVIEWMSQLPPERTPVVALELGSDPGVKLVRDEKGGVRIVPRDVNEDPRAVCYRYAAPFLKGVENKPLHVFTSDQSVSQLYEALMEVRIGTLQFPTPAVTSARNRVGTRTITVATLGHQQKRKGYHLTPAIAEQLLAARQDVRLLVHNSDAHPMANDAPALMRATQGMMRVLAANDSRIMLDERSVDFEDWSRLVDSCDLLICPYDPATYAMAHSGLASTGLANAIPMVVPAGTSLALWIEEFGGPGAAFESFEPASVVKSVLHVLDHYDSYAARAYEAAERWAATQGPANFVDSLLALYDEHHA